MILDQLALKFDAKFENKRLAFHTSIKHKGRTLHLIKPTTYMNLSGKSIRHWLNEEKIGIGQSLSITDDLALPFGKTRLKPKGSHGGHNGLRHIQELLETNEFPRLRIGVDDNFSKGKQVDYVLSPFDKKEQEELPQIIDKAVDTILSFSTIGIERTMNFFN
jgi:PTH1 family peptidyl-tRNA hydrolase